MFHFPFEKFSQIYNGFRGWLFSFYIFHFAFCIILKKFLFPFKQQVLFESNNVLITGILLPGVRLACRRYAE